MNFLLGSYGNPSGCNAWGGRGVITMCLGVGLVCQLETSLAPNAHVAGAWTERKKMFHGGSFLKLADDDV